MDFEEDAEEYTQEDIQDITDFIDGYILDQGIVKTLEYILEVKSNMEFWERYQQDRKNDSENEPTYPEVFKAMIDKNIQSKEFLETAEMIKQQSKIPKMPEEEEAQLEEDVKDYKKFWEITGKDTGIKEKLTSAINELEYDEEDVESRVQCTRCILLGLDILGMDEEDIEKADTGVLEKWNDMYLALINKIEELNYVDFTRLFQNTKNLYFIFGNPQCVKVVFERIDNMSLTEFMYFLLAVEDMVFSLNKDLFNKIKERINKEDNLLLYGIYDYLYVPGEMDEIKAPKRLFKLEGLFQDRFGSVLNIKRYKEFSFEERRQFEKEMPNSESFKKYLEIITKMTPKELIDYLLFNRYYFISSIDNINNLYTYCTKEEREVLSKKFEELSNKDIIILLEQYYPKFGNEESWKRNIKILETSNNKDVVEELESMYSFYTYLILEEAIKRDLISIDFEKNYSQEEIEEAEDVKQLFDDLNENDKFFIDIFPFDYESIEGEDEEEMLNMLNDDIKRGDQNAEEVLKMYEGLNQICNMTDAQICQVANIYNSKLAANQIVDFTPQTVLLNYIKHRIISLPTRFTSFFQMKEGGCLNDIMELKAEELHSLDIEKEQNLE